MADRADGSIRINTKLDNEGFEKGSSRLGQALQSLRDKILSVSGQLNGAFGLAQLRSNLMDTARSTQEFRDDVEGVAQTMASFDLADTFIQAQDVIGTLSQKMQEFAEKEYQMEDGSTRLGKQTEQYQMMVEALAQLKEKVDSVDESQKNTVGNYQDMAYFAAKFQETVSSMDQDLTMEQTADTVAELRRQMEAFGQMNFTFGGKLLRGEDTAGYKEMAATVEALEQKLEEMAHSPAWNEMIGKWKLMPTVSGMVKSTFVSALTTITTKAIQTGAMISSAVRDPLGALDRIGGAAVNAAGKLMKLGSGPAVAGLKAIANGAKKAAASLAEMAKNAVTAPFTKLGNALSGIFKRNSSMNGGFKTTLTTMLKYGLGIRSLHFLFNKLRNALVDGFKNLMQYDTGLAASVNEMKASLETLKNSFAAAFAPLAQVVLPILSRFINMLSQAVSYVGMFIASLTGQSTFKRAVAQQAAVADAAGDAADAYDAESAAAKKAQKTQASFDELHILDDKSDSGGGKGGTAGAGGIAFEDVPIESKIDDLAKKLKEMWDMADFTELGRMLGEGLKNLLDSIPWDRIKEIAAKLGKSLATLLNGFMEVPGLFYTIGKTIAEAINTLFEFLNAFVHNLHWDSLGYAIRDGILGFLNSLDWDLIFDTFATAGAGLGQAIEAAFDNPEIWTSIFTAISNLWNALLLFIYNLITTPDWAGIAQNIGIGLNAGVEAFPWDLLADTLAAALNMVFDIAYNFLTTFDFFKFGQHIGQALTDAVGQVNWQEGGASIGAAINALFDVINGFIEDTDWKLLGASVIDFIGGFFTEVDTSKWGEFAGNVLTSLFDFLSGALEEVDWEAVPGEIIGKIKDFFDNVDWDEVAESAMTLLGDALGAAFTVAVGLLTAVGGTLYEAFSDIWNGGVEGLLDAISDVKNWIKEHIFDPFIDGFKKTFGIASPSKKMKPLGENIIEGMGEGIISWLKGIPNWLSEHVGGPIIGGVKKLFGIGSGDPALKSSGQQTIEGMKNGMTNALSNATSWVKGNVTDKILNPVKDGFGINGNSEAKVFDDYGGQIADGLKSGISDGTKDMQSFIGSNVTDSVLDPVKSGFGISGNEARMFADYGKYMTASLKDAIQSGVPAITSLMSNLASSMFSAFGNIDWGGIGREICNGIYNGLQWGWDWLTNTAWNMAVNIFNAACRALGIHSPSKEFQWIGQMLTEGMAQGIDDTQKAAVQSTQALANAVTQEAENASAAITVGTAVSGLDDVLSTFSDKVTDSFAAMIARMEEIAAGSSFYVPAAAAGAVAPYSARVGDSGSAAASLDSIADKIDQAGAQQVTRRDLEEVMAAMLSRYLNIEFYIGNEQIARAANAGNTRINRRYSTLEG